MNIVEEKCEMSGAFGDDETDKYQLPVVWSKGGKWRAAGGAVWVALASDDEAGDAKRTCHDIIPEWPCFLWAVFGWRVGIARDLVQALKTQQQDEARVRGATKR